MRLDALVSQGRDGTGLGWLDARQDKYTHFLFYNGRIPDAVFVLSQLNVKPWREFRKLSRWSRGFNSESQARRRVGQSGPPSTTPLLRFFPPWPLFGNMGCTAGCCWLTGQGLDRIGQAARQPPRNASTRWRVAPASRAYSDADLSSTLQS